MNSQTSTAAPFNLGIVSNFIPHFTMNMIACLCWWIKVKQGSCSYVSTNLCKFIIQTFILLMFILERPWRLKHELVKTVSATYEKTCLVALLCKKTRWSCHVAWRPRITGALQGTWSCPTLPVNDVGYLSQKPRHNHKIDMNGCILFEHIPDE